MTDFEHDDGVDVTEDTLKVTLSFPTPRDHEVIARRLEEGAVQGKQGSTRTIMMLHEATGMEAYAEKSGMPFSSWQLTITDPNGDESEIDGRKDVSWIKDRNGLHEAASRFATRIVGPKEMLAEIKEHKLSDLDVLSVEVGQTGRVISRGGSSSESERMIVEAELTMPREYSELTDFHNDNAKRDYVNDIVRVGDHVTGYIRAEKQDDNSWIARGQGDVDYERVFKARDNLNLDTVALEIAQDMASLELSDQAIINHVRRQGAHTDHVKSISLDGETYEVTPDNGHDLG